MTVFIVCFQIVRNFTNFNTYSEIKQNKRMFFLNKKITQMHTKVVEL